MSLRASVEVGALRLCSGTGGGAMEPLPEPLPAVRPLCSDLEGSATASRGSREAGGRPLSLATATAAGDAAPAGLAEDGGFLVPCPALPSLGRAANDPKVTLSSAGRTLEKRRPSRCKSFKSCR